MQKSKKKRTTMIFISACMIALTCMGFYARNNLKFLIPFPENSEHRKRIEAYMETMNEQRRQREINKSALENIDMHSTHAFLIQLMKSGNEILLDRDGSVRMYPASMTKIMTAIVALENIEDLDVKIRLSETMFPFIYGSNSSIAGFLPGETVQALDLLYGLMLPSGAECAIGLAEYVVGTESDFVDLMNKKAGQLGMKDTHFMNTTGLHDNNHYSTARDIAALLEYAIQNDTFYKIFTTAVHTSSPTNRHTKGITFDSTMFSNMQSANLNNGMILGGKTGYTKNAGQCLASLAEKGGNRFILITCGAPGDIQTQQLHIDDMMKIFNTIT